MEQPLARSWIFPAIRALSEQLCNTAGKPLLAGREKASGDSLKAIRPPPIEHSEEVCAVCLPIGFYFLPIHTTLINTQLEKRKER